MSEAVLSVIRDESLEGAVTMGGDFEEFEIWNTILALYGLEPIR